jgi:hypothetical protein
LKLKLLKKLLKLRKLLLKKLKKLLNNYLTIYFKKG